MFPFQPNLQFAICPSLTQTQSSKFSSPSHLHTSHLPAITSQVRPRFQSTDSILSFRHNPQPVCFCHQSFFPQSLEMGEITHPTIKGNHQLLA